MNYKETLLYIHNTPKFARTLGNDLLRKLLEKNGNPQNDLKFIHIAGTNGKGSAAIMLSEILIHSGYSVGLFTSPYIECFNERIKVNGNMIENRSLSRITTKIRRIIEDNDTPVSEFALDTAIAFEYFKEKKCDIVVLETGLGGRLDATNVIEESLVSLIMSIGLDHTQYLGETISEISAEKCGIIKQNGHTVVYPVQEDAALTVINNTCKDMNNILHLAKTPEILCENRFTYDGKNYELSLNGDFQKYNAAAVLETVSVLKDLGYKIPISAIRKGLKSAFNPARLEKLSCGILLDGAHNKPAVIALCDTLRKYKKPINLCIAMMEDKDISSCIELFAATADKIIVTEIDMLRCASAETLAEKFSEYGKSVIIEKNPTKAIRHLIKITSEKQIACACGSLYFAGEVRKKFGENKPQKPYYVYILRCSDGTLYTGIATDAERRFEEHKSDKIKGAKYTRTHHPIEIAAKWEFKNRSDASKAEYRIKQLSKAQKEELIMKGYF